MPARQAERATASTDAANAPIGIDESKLWSMADALRGSMDATEYKHVVLGLIFLKYISDAFSVRWSKMGGGRSACAAVSASSGMPKSPAR